MDKLPVFCRCYCCFCCCGCSCRPLPVSSPPCGFYSLLHVPVASMSLPFSLSFSPFLRVCMFLPFTHKVLLKINELQTHDPKQFEELGLPLAIKRLAWETDAKTFVRIVSPHADKYLASEFCPKMVLSSQQVLQLVFAPCVHLMTHLHLLHGAPCCTEYIGLKGSSGYEAWGAVLVSRF